MTKLNITSMNWKILSFFLLCFLSFSAQAQITVSGQLLFGQDAQPLPFPGYPISISAENEEIETLTNDQGAYEVVLPLAEGDVIQVSILDFCTGEILAVELPGDNGTYVADFHICTDILPPPPPDGCEAYFTYEQVSVDPNEVNFFDLSFTAGPIDSWFWDFGDGSTSNEDNPVHQYENIGEYGVSLTITADTCTATFTSIVVVTEDLGCGCPEFYDPVCVMTPDGEILTFSNACFAECEGFGPDSWVPCDGGLACYASFYIDIDPGSDELTVNFVDQSFSTEGPVLTWSWEFGDGTTSAEANPSHTYAEAGIYEVILTITTETGCTSTSAQHICIGEGNSGCGCDDVYDPVCVQLPGGPVITFPNGCEAECAGFGPDFWIDCEANGCPCFEVYAPVCVLSDQGDTLTFANACFAACEGYGEDSFIDCGNNGPCDCGPEFDPVCVMGTDGNVLEFPNVCFAICAGYDVDNFVECDPNPCICPQVFAPVCVITEAGDTLSFTNACYAECEGYTADQFFDCDIDFPCDCPFIFDPVCVTTDEGELLFFFNACLAECEGYGADTFGDCDNTFPDECYADFFIDVNTNDQNPLTVQFNDLSGASAGEIISWFWDFGDGESSEMQNPLHTYAEDGIYEVTLTISTSEDCSATTILHICIGEGGPFQGPDCQAIFFFSQSGDNPHTFQFNDFSFGEATSWNWSFGDGFTSTEQNPSHTYTTDGVFLVTLTIASENCESTTSMILATEDDIWYNGSCTALFVPLITNDTSEVFFLNLSSPDAVEFSWDFGDGTTSSEQVPVHQYAEGGTYTITLTITSADGCTNSFSVTLDLEDNNFTGTPAYLLVSGTDETAQKLSIKAFPNPASDQLTIAMETSLSGDYQLELYTLAGQKQWTQSGKMTAGTQLVEVDIHTLPAGIYLLQIQVGNDLKQLKVVKQ